jgi:hypothetical protein
VLIEVILPPDPDEIKKEQKALREYELEKHEGVGYR